MRRIANQAGLLVVVSILLQACSSKPPQISNNYEVEALDQGEKGTILMKVYSYGTTKDKAIQKAKLNAVHAVMFKGVPGSNLEDPLVKNSAPGYDDNNYFNDFFGVKNHEERKTIVNSEAPYLRYVARSNDGAVDPSDRLKVDNGYKIGVKVQVMHGQLRKQLEKDNIIKEFGL